MSMQPPLTNAAPPTAPPPSALRLVIFLAVTLTSAWLMAGHFAAIPETIKAQGGNKLSQAGMTIAGKIVLVSQWDILRPYASAFGSTDTLLSAYKDQLEHDDKAIDDLRKDGSLNEADRQVRIGEIESRSTALREQYVVMLVALGDVAAATHALEPLEKASPEARESGAALRDAFGLDPGADRPGAAASSSPAASASPKAGPAAAPVLEPLPSPRAEEDMRALASLEGWQGIAARLALAHRQKDQAKAASLQAQLQEQAQRIALQLVGIATVFGLNFVFGLIVLLLWTVRGREWDLRSTDTDLSDPPPSAAFDPLAGWSMLLVFQLVSGLVGSIILAVLNQSGGSVATHGTVLMVIGVQIVIYALMVACIGIAIRFRWASIGLHLRRPFRSAFSGLCLFWGAFIVVLAFGWVMSRVFDSTNAQNNPVFKIIEEAVGGRWQLVALLALVAFLGPLFEEILFRGVLYTSMRRVMPAHLAIPLNGVLFSAVHGDLNTLVPLAVLGMFLAYGYERTHSLATSVVCHCLWNAQTFLVFLTLFS